jgi:hypothetical protein
MERCAALDSRSERGGVLSVLILKRVDRGPGIARRRRLSTISTVQIGYNR